MDLESSSETLCEDQGPYYACMGVLMVPDSEVEPDDDLDVDHGKTSVDLVVLDTEEASHGDDDEGPMELVVPDSEEEEEVHRAKQVLVLDSEEAKEKRWKEIEMHPIRKSPRLEAFLKLILPDWESRM
ncbi:unnamed protein product [Cuscuta europaea]|uniref:Uncharacterized protein n=1 Tax=Cuscuta europaea TaxID=41803 RepID=A0A9P0ZNF5_CUSEU|nr:unnamed protein product [Cuscuta europaea]